MLVGSAHILALRMRRKSAPRASKFLPSTKARMGLDGGGAAPAGLVSVLDEEEAYRTAGKI
jgi:hypothetical protein